MRSGSGATALEDASVAVSMTVARLTSQLDRINVVVAEGAPVWHLHGQDDTPVHYVRAMRCYRELCQALLVCQWAPRGADVGQLERVRLENRRAVFVLYKHYGHEALGLVHVQGGGVYVSMRAKLLEGLRTILDRQVSATRSTIQPDNFFYGQAIMHGRNVR